MHSSFSHPRFHGWCTWKLKTSSTFKNTEDEVHVLNSHLIQYSYSTNPSFTSEIFCCRNIVARIFRREPNSSKITFNANTIWFTRFPISVAEISVAELFRRVMSCREFSARIEVVGINWWLKVSVLPCRQINGFCFRYFSAGAPNLIGKSPRLDDAPVFIPFFMGAHAQRWCCGHVIQNGVIAEISSLCSDKNANICFPTRLPQQLSTEQDRYGFNLS